MMRPNESALRAHYARTAFARMGIPFERAMRINAVRIAVEGAAARDDQENSQPMKRACAN